MSSKRKSYSGGTPGHEAEDRDAKRRKIPGTGVETVDNPFQETARSTTEQGLKLVETIRKVEDKTGRVVATNFLHLPSKRDLPDYYDIIKMPIALDTIEAKLRRHEFLTLTALESYFKRMIQNAKEYNEKGSEIYNDAERLRKSLSNFMTKNNPGYKTQGFKVEPAPIVENEGGQIEGVEEATSLRKSVRLPKTSNAPDERSSTTPARSGAVLDENSFVGLSFQQAQEKIMEDLITYKEEPEDQYAMFQVFVNLPSRDLKDYYQIIRDPMALKKLQKLVKGPQGVSELKSWAAFEEKASYIWKNACHYNEDGSEISELAKTLEKSFKKALKEAREAVPEPIGTKIKLKVPEAPKITLKLGLFKATPAESPAAQTPEPSTKNTTVNDPGRRNPFVGSQFAPTPLPILESVERTRSSSGAAPSPTLSASAPVKNEDAAQNSPALNPGHANARSGTNIAPAVSMNGSGMLPPQTSNLPVPNGHTNGGYNHSFNPQPTNHHVPHPVLESKWRKPGQDASHALITNLSLATHPTLNISRHLRMDLTPSPTMTHQSITVNLPHTHFSLQIKPTLAPSLRERQYKLFVTAGTQRLHALATIPGHGVDPRHPLFETRLTPGVNRIEVEIVAAPPKGSARPSGVQDMEIEKMTVFANLMRA